MCEPKTAATNGQPTPTLERTPHDIFVGAGLALAGGVFWGVNATVSKLLMNDYHADPLWIACVRELLAGVVFLVCAGIFTPDKFINSLKDYRSYPRLLLCAFFCVLMVQVSYLKAIDWTNSGTATVLQTLNLLVVLVFVCIMGKRLPGKRESIGVVLAFVGTVLIATGGDLSQLSLPLPGLLWGLTDAVCTSLLAILPIALMAKWGNFHGQRRHVHRFRPNAAAARAPVDHRPRVGLVRHWSDGIHRGVRHIRCLLAIPRRHPALRCNARHHARHQ